VHLRRFPLERAFDVLEELLVLGFVMLLAEMIYMKKYKFNKLFKYRSPFVKFVAVPLMRRRNWQIVTVRFLSLPLHLNCR
jgi:hypothetical protein